MNLENKIIKDIREKINSKEFQYYSSKELEEDKNIFNSFLFFTMNDFTRDYINFFDKFSETVIKISNKTQLEELRKNFSAFEDYISEYYQNSNKSFVLKNGLIVDKYEKLTIALTKFLSEMLNLNEHILSLLDNFDEIDKLTTTIFPYVRNNSYYFLTEIFFDFREMLLKAKNKN